MNEALLSCESVSKRTRENVGYIYRNLTQALISLKCKYLGTYGQNLLYDTVRFIVSTSTKGSIEPIKFWKRHYRTCEI